MHKGVIEIGVVCYLKDPRPIHVDSSIYIETVSSIKTNKFSANEGMDVLLLVSEHLCPARWLHGKGHVAQEHTASMAHPTVRKGADRQALPTKIPIDLYPHGVDTTNPSLVTHMLSEFTHR